jgi:hypothetical protein
MVLIEFISNFFLVSKPNQQITKEDLRDMLKIIDDFIVIDICIYESVEHLITSLSKKNIQILKSKADTITSNSLINTIGHAYVNDNKSIFIIFDDDTKLRSCLSMFLQSFAGASGYPNNIDDILNMNLKSIN